jgi:hypothetical protein
VPKPVLNSVPSKIVKPTLEADHDDKVIFSFAALERTEYFNLDCTCEKWSSDLFDMLKSISETSKKDLMSGKYRTYRVHNHEKAKPPSPLPRGVELKDFYQLRISTSKGGIHGVFVNNIFYIIWVDPLHNMYPDDRFGGLRTIKPPATCCMDRDSQISGLLEENRRLNEKLAVYEI